MDDPDVRVGVAPSRQGTIQTGASWMWLARCSAAASILSNCSRLVPGAGSPDRYLGATCSSQARLYKAPTASLTLGSWTTRNRHRCIFPPLGAQTPASRIFRINSFGTGSDFSRRIDRVVRMISNRSVVIAVFSGIAYPLCVRYADREVKVSLHLREIAMTAESVRSVFLCSLTGFVAPPRDVGAT